MAYLLWTIVSQHIRNLFWYIYGTNQDRHDSQKNLVLGTDKYPSTYLLFKLQIWPLFQFLKNPMYQSPVVIDAKLPPRSVDLKASGNRILLLLNLTNNLRSDVNALDLRYYYTFIGQLNPINRKPSAAGEQ